MSDRIQCAVCGSWFTRDRKPGARPKYCSAACRRAGARRRLEEHRAQGRSGICACGCGLATPAAPTTSKERGWVRGEPTRYVIGHSAKGLRKRKGPDYLVDPDTGCWVWQHAKIKGYGRGTFDGTVMQAHRYYYEAANGPVPDGLELDHLCRNRACCNPDHLEPVTRSVNAQRGERARLTADQVAEIRSLTSLSWSQIAARYGVTKSAIQGVLTGRTWRNS